MKRSHRIIAFFTAVVLSFTLMYFAYHPLVGYLGRVLILFSTLFHEMGHGLTAAIFGDFNTLEIYWDGSGSTGWSAEEEPGRIARALISAGGLIGPSIGAALLFWSCKRSDTTLNWISRGFGIFLVLAGILVARSIWALVFTLGLGMLLLAITGRISRAKLESIIVFIGVQLGLSVFTRADYLFTEWAGPNKPSDVAKMAESLFLPYWFWGAICGFFSVLVLFWGCKCYFDPVDGMDSQNS